MASLKPRQSAICTVGRIAKDDLAAADQHRHIGRADVEAIQQRLDALVAIEVDRAYTDGRCASGTP